MMKWISLICFVTVLGIFGGCSESSHENYMSSAELQRYERNVFGFSQKGPFQKGSTVSLYEMDDSLIQLGNYHVTEVKDSSGAFSLEEISFNHRYAWLQVDGKFFNELRGSISDTKISLNSLADLGQEGGININILSHLAFNRIRKLVRNGIPVERAKAQAEAEVMKSFSFALDSVHFEKLNVFGDEEYDGALLAASLIVLSVSNSYAMDEIFDQLSKIALDIEEDGMWDELDTTKMNVANSVWDMVDEKRLERIRQTLEESGYGSVPPFEKYMLQFAEAVPVYGICEEENAFKRNTYEMEIREQLIRNPTVLLGAARDGLICKSSRWRKYGGAYLWDGSLPDTTGLFKVMVDSRDGKTYKTVELVNLDGSRSTWLAEPLRYGSFSDSGYTWNQTVGSQFDMGSYSSDVDVVQGVCPEGWHLPSVHEWRQAFGDDNSVDSVALKNDYLMSVEKYILGPRSYGSGMLLSNDAFFLLDPEREFVSYGVLGLTAKVYRVKLNKETLEFLNVGVRCVKN